MSTIQNTVNQFILSNDIEGLKNYVLKTLQATGVSRAKIIKNFIEILETMKKIPNTLPIVISICENTIQWAISSNKSLLKQQIQQRLAQCYYENGQYPQALQLIAELLMVSKKMDDKLAAVELQLLETKVHLKVKNISKARGAMTGAKVDANAIYIQPVLQGDMDMTSGFINGTDKDYVTAASYFFEAFENYFSLNMKDELINALKYLILMKIMQKKMSDIETLMFNKHVIVHADNQNIVALLEIAKAFEKRNIDEYNIVIQKYTNELTNDTFTKENLDVLYYELLQENICRILEPYSSVELSHISEIIKLNQNEVEKILRLMILENKINGIIDQSNGILILYEDVNSNKILSSGITLIEQLSKLVDTLNDKAMKVIQETTLSQPNQSEQK